MTVRQAQDAGTEAAYADAAGGQDPASYYGHTHAPDDRVPQHYRGVRSGPDDLGVMWARAYCLTMIRIAGRRVRGEPDRGLPQPQRVRRP